LSKRKNNTLTLKALAMVRVIKISHNAFSVGANVGRLDPRVVASSNPGLELANAFSVVRSNLKLQLYSPALFLV
jgi:hypothetical protein